MIINTASLIGLRPHRPTFPKGVWEHALTCPLPPQTSYELLAVLRNDIMRYLVWVTYDLVQTDTEGAVREIQRIANCLKIIATMPPAVISAHMADYAHEVTEAKRNRQQ